MAANFKCPVHVQEPLDTVCLMPKCTQNMPLICFLCKIESHEGHEPIVPLKLFLGQILDDNQAGQNLIKESALIDRQLLSIKSMIYKMQKKMLNIKSILTCLDTFWMSITRQVIHFDLIISELRDIISKKEGDVASQLNKWILKHGGKYSLINDQQSKQSIYVHFLKSKSMKLDGILNQLGKIQKKALFDDRDVLELFNQEEQSYSHFKIRFSEELKGTCMTISAPNKASMTVHGNQRMILLQPNLASTRKIKKWKVKIQKLASWIGIGVAHLPSIKGANFDFSYTSANHGNYLISSNGYSWNGFKMQYNSKFQTFQFTTGDVVEVTYDPVNSKVSFKKESTQAIFTYDVDPQQKPIHAAINMTGVGDSVQIL